LLRVLQEKEVRPVGSSASKTVDVRVIAATNRSVEEAVHRGVFRQDLFYRLNVVRICTPPLRECRTDIPALAAHFIRQLNVRFRREVRGIQAAALAALSAHDFPGNVRELEHLLESAYALGATSTITLGDLPALSAGPRSELAPFECAGVLPSLSDALARVERELIGRALAVHGDNRDEAAQALGLSVRTFYRRLKALGLG
jgi:transcriptional regulator with PAS, ATPase and Fis domain